MLKLPFMLCTPSLSDMLSILVIGKSEMLFVGRVLSVPEESPSGPGDCLGFNFFLTYFIALNVGEV